MWTIEPISQQHELEAFQSGEPKLDEWLKRHALANHNVGISTTHVLVRQGEARVLGFYALSSYGVKPTNIPGSKKEGVPQGGAFLVPCTLLGRLARDLTVKGEKLGPALLAHALRTALHSSQGVASYAVVVHAKHEKAKAWYIEHDFTPLLDDPLHLFLHMRKIREAVTAAK